jgi:hypothetical protein
VTRQSRLGARIKAALGLGTDQAGTRARPPVQRKKPAGGGLHIEYTPRADGLPDPGEVVWTWVPYEEDASQGKDRPVLIVGRRGDQLVGLMLTSKDHDRDAEQEARWGRHWLDVGVGGWDRLRRPSEVRLDRLLTIDPSAVRREGAALDRRTFQTVVSHLPRH